LKITKEKNVIPEAPRGIKWSLDNLRKDITQEERDEVYEWTQRIDQNLNELEDNVKIITLHKKCQNIIHGKAIAIAYEHRNYTLMNTFVKYAEGHESRNNFYKFAELCSRPNKNKSSYITFRETWKYINRENSLIISDDLLKIVSKDLLIHMYESCRILNSKLIKLGDVVKDIKDQTKDK
jgi:hypothetical protein